MPPTKSTSPAQQKPAENQKPNTGQPGTVAEAQSGAPETHPPAPSADPVGEAAQRRAEEARVQQTPGQEAKEEERQKPSTTAVGTGDHLWYRGDYGPVFALVTWGGEGEAHVLLLRPDEVVKARTVVVYDTAEDAERGYAEGNLHVAWHI